MSSPCRTEALCAAAAALLAVCGCSKNPSIAYTPPGQGKLYPVAVSQLIPGGGPAPAPDPRGKLYEGDPTHIARGRQYYTWYNCNGCHFNGGGGIGPALMDKTWRYGGTIDDIHNSIAEGRPNGMPVWGGKIPDSQIWEIAAYVESMSPPTPSSMSTAGTVPAPPVQGTAAPSPPPPSSAPPPPGLAKEPQSPGGKTVAIKPRTG